MKNKTKKSKLAIALYVIAAIFVVVTVIMIVDSVKYVNSYASQYGMKFADLGVDAYKTIMTSSIQYIFYAIATFGLGYIIQMVKNVSAKLDCCCEEEACDCGCGCEAEEVVATEVETVEVAEEVATEAEETTEE